MLEKYCFAACWIRAISACFSTVIMLANMYLEALKVQVHSNMLEHSQWLL